MAPLHRRSRNTSKINKYVAIKDVQAVMTKKEIYCIRKEKTGLAYASNTIKRKASS